jgi:hypothetical protein
MKMLINITGNIASGKTTLINHIKEYFPEALFLSIDEYRIKHNASLNFNNEIIAWKALFEKALDSDFVFVESSGTSKFIRYLSERYDGDVVNILLHCDKAICKNRLANRNKALSKNSHQFPYEYSIESSIDYIDSALNCIKYDYKINSNQDITSIKAIFLKIFNIESSQ